MAYLMWKHSENALEAFNFVQARRSVVWPNYGFYDQLIQWSMLRYNLMDLEAYQEGGKPKEEPRYMQMILEWELETPVDGSGDLGALEIYRDRE